MIYSVFNLPNYIFADIGGRPHTLMDKVHEPRRLHPLNPVGQTIKHNFCKKNQKCKTMSLKLLTFDDSYLNYFLNNLNIDIIQD